MTAPIHTAVRDINMHGVGAALNVVISVNYAQSPWLP